MWDLVTPRLSSHDVLVPALPGHVGGPPLPREITPTTMVEAVERVLDAAGFEVPYVVGNSLGGYLALQSAGARPGAGGDGVRAGRRVGRRGRQARDARAARAAHALDDRVGPVRLSLQTVADVMTAAARCVEAPRMSLGAARNP